MKWTTEKPTEPGWWFCRIYVKKMDVYSDVITMKLNRIHGGLYAKPPFAYYPYKVSELIDREWAGPIPEPQEND